MADFELVPNPAYAGMAPRPLEVACHDRTPFLTVRCAECLNDMHIHESQIEGVELGITTLCIECGELLAFPPRFFVDAFQTLRDQGWVAQ